MTNKTCSESTFASHDGVRLFYRAWRPAVVAKKALLLFHRGHEHSGRWAETVAALGLEDVAVFAWDARGHGQSPGERGAAENMGVLTRDVEAFVRHVAQTEGIAIEDMVIVAHSVGAVAVAAWVHDFAPPIRGLVLATPAFRVKLYVPLAVPLLRFKEKAFGPGTVKSYVKARVLTHDPKEAEAYAADKMIFRQISVRVLLDLFDTSTRLLADAGAIRVPTLMLAAGKDWVVKVSAQRQFFEKLGSPDKTFVMLPGFYHAIFHEQERAQVVKHVREFAERMFRGETKPRPSLVGADQVGYTRTEYDGLTESLHSPLAAVQRMVLGTVGKFSRGIALGWRTGFDSGQTLDYVYENQPRGITPLGRMIDRQYLNSPGWSGIRVRRANLERILRGAIERVHAEGRPVHIVDVACGAGRYVLETLHALPGYPTTALLRDYKEENVVATARLRDRLGFNGRVTVTQGNAFDREGLAALSPKPTIAIVSGLFELFPSNAPVLECLRGLAAAMAPGSLLIYTNQPWHPQLKFIAQVLPNREGQPWVMRRRTQEEMDELARTAGFEKLSQDVDQWGIFTVSLARRVGS
jgi:alpha-beta hydrolase superfamily lysophospholipase